MIYKFLETDIKTSNLSIIYGFLKIYGFLMIQRLTIIIANDCCNIMHTYTQYSAFLNESLNIQ